MRFFTMLRELRPVQKAILVILVGASVLCISTAVYLNSKLDLIHFENTSSDADFGSGLAKVNEVDILLLGTDERAVGGGLGDFDASLQELARSDATMLLHLNFQEKTAGLTSLERAIGVPVKKAPGGEDWLTHAFAYGGADAMMEAVSNLLDIEPKRYVRVNVSSAAALIDAIGGVDITLTEVEAQALNGEIYTNSITNHRVKPGLNHLDGFDAIAYARQRFIDSDFERMQRQRNVLQAAIDQTKNLNVRELDRLLNTALPLIQTNLSKNEIKFLLSKAPGFLGVTLDQMTLPLSGMYGAAPTVDGRSMMMLDHEEAARIYAEFCAGTFELEGYRPSDEVRSRVARAEQKAYAGWQPPALPAEEVPMDSGVVSEDEIPAPSEDEEVVEEPEDETNGSGVVVYPPRDKTDTNEDSTEEISENESDV